MWWKVCLNNVTHLFFYIYGGFFLWYNCKGINCVRCCIHFLFVCLKMKVFVCCHLQLVIMQIKVSQWWQRTNRLIADNTVIAWWKREERQLESDLETYPNDLVVWQFNHLWSCFAYFSVAMIYQDIRKNAHGEYYFQWTNRNINSIRWFIKEHKGKKSHIWCINHWQFIDAHSS